MRSISGWLGSFRGGVRTLCDERWFIASASDKLSGCWLRSRKACRTSGCGCIPTRRGSCTARMASGVVRLNTRRSRSWGTRSASAGAEQEWEEFHRVPARDQQERSEEDRAAGAVLANSHPHLSHFPRARATGQSHRPRLDAVLRRFLPLCPVSSPARASMPTWCDGSVRNIDDSGHSKKHAVLKGDTTQVSPLFAQWEWVPSVRLW